jgi:hypothetical protein
MVLSYTDNCGNSTANTCGNPDFGRDVFIRYLTNLLRETLVNHGVITERMTSSRRQVIQISALSTFVGRIEAYRGDNG